MDSAKIPASNPPEQKLHFLDYWRIVRIRKTVILAVFLLVVLTTTAVTFILPEWYSSTVKLEIGQDSTDIAPLLAGVQAQRAYDPYFIQTEFEKIRSKNVLYPVIESLNLNEIWAKRYGTDGKLKTSESFQILLRQMDVRQTRNTSLIEIRVRSRDREEASRIANKIAERYGDSRLDRRLEASQLGIAKLQEKLKVQEDKVKEAQATADSLRQKLRVSDFDAGGFTSTLEPETLRHLERERGMAEAQSVQISTVLERLKTMRTSQLRQTIPTAWGDQLLNDLLRNLTDAEVRFAIRKLELGSENPELLSIAALISTLNQQIDARVDGFLRGLETRAESEKARAIDLAAKVEQAKDRDTENMELYRPYFVAKREVETQQRIYDTIMLRVLQESVDADLPKTSMITITDPAEAGLRPILPNVTLNIVLGVIVGLMMGLGLAFFIEYLDTSVKTIDDVERALQAPVLGVIPQNVGPLIEEGPDSPHAEAYRVLRTNVLFSRKDPGATTLTVVSGGAGEGKSTTIFNLATIFAQNGHRVLIVDSDLRRPSLHKILNVSNSSGLTNYLLKQNTLEEVIQTTPVPSLHFLPSGKLPSSSLGILNSAQMKEFIRQAKERYDFVFFDSPPIMGVSDASILASEVDMALLVIQYRKYPQAMTVRAKQMVEKVGGNLLGVVLNNINISQDSYYYYYSGYYYDYYSKNEDEDGSKKNGGSKKAAAGERAALDLKQKY